VVASGVGHDITPTVAGRLVTWKLGRVPGILTPATMATLSHGARARATAIGAVLTIPRRSRRQRFDVSPANNRDDDAGRTVVAPARTCMFPSR